MTSPITIFEATLKVLRKRHASVEEAEQDVGEFLELAGVRIEPITDSSQLSLATARDGDTLLSSTSATALPTPWRKTRGRGCCTRAKILTPPTFCPLRSNTKNWRLGLGSGSENALPFVDREPVSLNPMHGHDPDTG